MQYKRVNSLQHIGVGNPDLEKTWAWQRKFFGMDIPMFDAVAEAPLMNVYTKGKPINKHAAMVLNLQGGCAMELVNPKSFTAKGPDFTPQVGDYGIYITQMKVKNVADSFAFFKKNGGKILGEMSLRPDGTPTFIVEDPNKLLFQVVQGDGKWFTNTNFHSGGVVGCTVGVSDIAASQKLYSDLLGYNKVLYDKTDVFADFAALPGGEHKIRRVLLTQGERPAGGFAEVMGETTIELIQVLDREARKIYKGRIWGDTGFVHIGMDVKGMKALEIELAAHGFPFTCDSNSALSMGQTRVHCTYIQDPDGTLIELIEVYKIPILEKLGIFLNVEKRDPLKPLPRLMLKALSFSRRKD